MPIQLDLLDPKRGATERTIWSQLPAPVRREVIELFATLLTTLVRPTAQEDTDESHEDSNDASHT